MTDRAIGYIRVSTQDQGAGMKAQRRSIEQAVAQRGWQLLRIEEDVASGGSTNGRHGLDRAMCDLDTGQAEILVAAKLDRLSRSMFDFADIIRRAQKRGWALITLDIGMDMTTPVGELTANVLMAIAQFERRRISERIREALVEKREEGVRLGRPPVLPDLVRYQIHEMHDAGLSLHAIARTLNAEGVPTAHGGRCWYASTVGKLVRGFSTFQ